LGKSEHLLAFDYHQHTLLI